MAAKLKNLRIRKVDFVDEGANPDAHILLFKNREGEPAGREGGKGSGGFWKRLASVIREAVELAPEESGGGAEGIQKENAAGFHGKLNEMKNRKVADEIWDLCYALQSSLCSILTEEGMDASGTEAVMKESLGEFQAVMEEAGTPWAAGDVSGIVRKAEPVPGGKEEPVNPPGCQSGTGQKEVEGEEEMKIDKSRLTPAELAFLESMEKRYGYEETDAAGGAFAGVQAQQAGGVLPAAQVQQMQENPVAKSVEMPVAGMQVPAASAEAQVQQAPEDIYKGLHPAVRAELEELRKFREASEERELAEVAKKYAIIGKKEEELVPMFKGLKAAGGSAYQDMIAVLDQAVDTVEKSGVFAEIGKAGGRGMEESSSEAKIHGIAKGYMEKDPALSYERAMAKAWEDHPDILEEYEKEAGF